MRFFQQMHWPWCILKWLFFKSLNPSFGVAIEVVAGWRASCGLPANVRKKVRIWRDISTVPAFLCSMAWTNGDDGVRFVEGFVDRFAFPAMAVRRAYQESAVFLAKALRISKAGPARSAFGFSTLRVAPFGKVIY
jgi:hypothetical protein